MGGLSPLACYTHLAKEHLRALVDDLGQKVGIQAHQ
jgi:hypothetical protein